MQPSRQARVYEVVHDRVYLARCRPCNAPDTLLEARCVALGDAEDERVENGEVEAFVGELRCDQDRTRARGYLRQRQRPRLDAQGTIDGDRAEAVSVAYQS